MNARKNGSNINNTVNIKATLDRIRANPKIALIVSIAFVASLVAAMVLWAQEPDYRVLYNNISERDGGAIVAELAKMKVPYRFEHGGALMVPEQQVYELRLKLAQQGLPKGGAVGFELLDNEKFGISQFSEQVNFQRALEGELSRTIETLGPVQSVRVHLAIPKPSLFVHDRKPPSASVTLNLTGGRSLGADQVNAITWLIASAVPGLAADKVTIIDQNGNLLTQNSKQAVEASQLKYASDVEAEFQNRIQAILTPIVGSENIRAQVTAQIDFTTHEQTAEQYEPNSSPDKMSVRSRQSSLSEQGGKNAIGGVPGALSNQPPVPATTPIDKPAASKENAKQNGQRETSSSQTQKSEPFNRRQDETTNYELDRTLTHIKRSVGQIERLSVAVVVNYQQDKQGKSVALSKQQLDQINSLVKEAMGYSTARGDTLSVINSPFVVKEEENKLRQFWKQPEFLQLMLTLGRYLLIALITWILWKRIIQPVWFRHQEFIKRRIELEKEAHEAEINAINAKKDNREKARAQQRVDAELHTQQLRDLADHEPQIIALVIRQWMSKEFGTK